MIEKLKIFNYEILKHKIPPHLYGDVLLNDSVNRIFTKKEIINEKCEVPEKIGKGYSTIRFGNHYVTSLKNISPLLNYISKFILDNYYKEKDANKKILFTRMWLNKIYKNCSGKCHVHGTKNYSAGTAIFYFNAPQNGSKLIILKENIGDEKVTKTHKNITHYIEVKSGDLIVHTQDAPHAVSEHLSDEPRICLVLDFVLSAPSSMLGQPSL